MAIHQPSEAVTPGLEQPQRPLNGSALSRDSRYMSTAEVADECRYVGKHRLKSVYRFLALKGIPIHRKGKRSILVSRSRVIAAIEGKKVIAHGG